jgi:glycosyltransferase involved in cell wall biosynthesis
VRTLLLSDAPNFTSSYGNIARHFADAVRPHGVEVGFCSFQHSGEKLIYRYNGHDYPLYGAGTVFRAADAVKDFQPDVVLHMREPVALVPRFYPQAYSVRAIAEGHPVWGWTAVQAETVAYDYVDAMHREYDLVLPFTECGGELLGNSGIVRDRIETLVPGISAAYGEPEGPTVNLGRPGVPLVMSVGVHDQDRKAFPVLMRGYREIVEDVDLDFYLHTAMTGAFDMLTHARDMGVSGHWLFPMFYDKSQGMSEEHFSKYYRTAHAYATVGTGEGLNMPLLEAACMGRFVIAPDMPNNREVLEGYPEDLKAFVSTFPIPRVTSWEWLPDPVSMGKALRRVPDAVPSADDGRAHFALHSWERTAERFVEIAHKRGFL